MTVPALQTDPPKEKTPALPPLLKRNYSVFSGYFQRNTVRTPRYHNNAVFQKSPHKKAYTLRRVKGKKVIRALCGPGLPLFPVLATRFRENAAIYPSLSLSFPSEKNRQVWAS